MSFVFIVFFGTLPMFISSFCSSQNKGMPLFLLERFYLLVLRRVIGSCFVYMKKGTESMRKRGFVWLEKSSARKAAISCAMPLEKI